MTLRDEIHSHHEKTWIICLGEEFAAKPLTPLVDLVDWYNNQLITKSILTNQVKLGLGDRTLMATSGLLPAEKLLILGLGKSEQLTATQAKKFLQDVGQTLEGLGETNPWLVIAGDTSDKFVEEIKKSRTSITPLSQANISVG
jgi:hypothetical protein